MIVVDTNVIGYLHLASDKSHLSEAALQRDPDWSAPLLWRSELSNVLATYIRHDRLRLSDGLAAMSLALELMRGREYEVAPARSLALAAEGGCSAYDCEFAALALDLGVSLVTVDRNLLDRFPDTAISLELFVA